MSTVRDPKDAIRGAARTVRIECARLCFETALPAASTLVQISGELTIRPVKNRDRDGYFAKFDRNEYRRQDAIERRIGSLKEPPPYLLTV